MACRPQEEGMQQHNLKVKNVYPLIQDAVATWAYRSISLTDSIFNVNNVLVISMSLRPLLHSSK